ncbi:MAG TPA: D-alanyl-D-alanine carboxypeptidase family protein [Clostridia bacterium]|nr:D-alanyl-D-alanine carboxypeptidase family protein [Clostridia bacterium]
MRKTVIFLLFFCLTFTGIGTFQAEAAWNPTVPVTCNAVYLVNSDTGTVVYEKNAHEKIYPASITKIMTALVTVKQLKDNLSKTVTVEQEDIDALSGTSSSTSGLSVGENLTVEQLLYCMMLPSGNDAAVVLARVVGGSEGSFVRMMNDEAKSIGATNTHYVNPHGLHDPSQYTTAYDTYLISREAMKDDKLAKIVDTTTYNMPKTNKNDARILTNRNGLINPVSSYYYKYVRGIKTGTTSQAGACLASYAEKDGYTYYCIAMGGTENNGANSAFSTSKALYKWVFGNFQVSALLSQNDPQAEVKVELAWNIDSVLLVPDSQLNALVPDTFSQKDVTVKPVNKPASVKAPLKKGQKVCRADVFLSGKKMGTVNLVSSKDIALSRPLYFVYIVGVFFKSIWFKVISVLLILLFIGYLALSFSYNRRKKTLNRVKKKYKLPK